MDKIKDKITAYWWIVRHPFKAAAIRRYLEEQG